MMLLMTNDRCATMQEAAAEYTRNVGSDHPDREWILSNYDTWERNPYYRGAPGPHPDDDGGDEIFTCDRPEVFSHPQPFDARVQWGWDDASTESELPF